MSLRDQMEAFGLRRVPDCAAYASYVGGLVTVQWKPKGPFRRKGPVASGWVTVWLDGHIVWSADRMMPDDMLLDLMVEEEGIREWRASQSTS